MTVILPANAPWAGVAIVADHRSRPTRAERKIGQAGIVLDDRAKTPADGRRDRHEDRHPKDGEPENSSAFATALLAETLPQKPVPSEKRSDSYGAKPTGRLRDRRV